jgi:hypothetical protein
MGYRKLLRVTYATLLERYSKPGRILSTRNPQVWALRATSGLVSLHVVSAVIAFDLATDALASQPRIHIYGAVFAAAGLASWFVLKHFLLNERDLAAVRSKWKSETPGDAGMRNIGVTCLQMFSYILFVVLLYSTD